MRDQSLTVSQAFECPKCEKHGSRVFETRSTVDRESVIRMRRCRHCGREFSTLEITVNEKLTRGQLEQVLARIDSVLPGRMT